ncbi:MAG: hypothetical protein DCC75_07880 [Proteobacteria bacterium]|nr:MAG: hypothetical protein DCC75_07880 [Pseudomonadota bacterium]
MGLEHATLGVLIIIALIVLPVLFYIKRARQSREMYVRRIAGVDAIDEATGRAAELGKPIAFSSGLTTVSPVLYACLGVLFHVAKKSARYKTHVLVPQNDPAVMAIADNVMREAYRAEGRLSAYDPKSIVYLSDEQFAFAAGYMGLVQRERIATAFLLGVFAAESLMLAEAGQQVGAMQVAASITPEQVPFFICTCDYTLIGEELYGASAYLTKEPVQLGSLYGQDRAKLLFFCLIIVGTLISTFNAVAPTLWGFSPVSNITDWIVIEVW